MRTRKKNATRQEIWGQRRPDSGRDLRDQLRSQYATFPTSTVLPPSACPQETRRTEERKRKMNSQSLSQIAGEEARDGRKRKCLNTVRSH